MLTSKRISAPLFTVGDFVHNLGQIARVTLVRCGGDLEVEDAGGTRWLADPAKCTAASYTDRLKRAMEIGGLTMVYLPVNQAWCLTWGEGHVLRVGTRDYVTDYAATLVHDAGLI
jgi:hypothetical protein